MTALPLAPPFVTVAAMALSGRVISALPALSGLYATLTAGQRGSGIYVKSARQAGKREWRMDEQVNIWGEIVTVDEKQKDARLNLCKKYSGLQRGKNERIVSAL